MSTDIYEALARTAQLLRLDVFRSEPRADGRIVDGLRATSVRIVADRHNVLGAGGQTALFTLYAQLAMLGVMVDVDVPNIDVVAPQPPFEQLRLVDALQAYSDDLMPGGTSAPADRAHITFALGDTPCSGHFIRISGNAHAALVGSDVESTRIRWSGNEPFGAIAAAAAGAADAARAAVPEIASRLGVAPPALSAWTFAHGRLVSVDLSPLMPAAQPASASVDLVSGGAISNALIFSLLRVPDLRVDLRVIEPEILDLSNLNRYSTARRSWVGELKTSMLASYSRPSVTIRGVPVYVDNLTAATLRPWARMVAVGVDDIRARWFVQSDAVQSWIGVGATSHDYVLVSEHVPDHACAGCSHPRPDDADGPIPTIGFVSLWAGLLLALKLLSADARATSTGVHVWPLGLENERGIHRFTQAPAPNCPIRCSSSQSLAVNRAR